MLGIEAFGPSLVLGWEGDSHTGHPPSIYLGNANKPDGGLLDANKT